MVLKGMATVLELLIAGVLGYLLGAIPTGVLICRAVRAPDARWSGSGHTGGLNVSRSAGIWAGVLTGVVDALLGLGAVAGASALTDNPWAATAAGVMAVVGHNWSVFIRFSGGIGISTLFGAIFYLSPVAALVMLIVLLPLWLMLIKLLRIHRAQATILLTAIAGPLLWLLQLPWPSVLLGVMGGAMVILKTLPDWNRQYE
jgi:glycerol-3-phosphate acyltransferase PlsY